MSLIWVGERQTVLQFNPQLLHQIDVFCYDLKELQGEILRLKQVSPVVGMYMSEVTECELTKMSELRSRYPLIRLVIYVAQVKDQILQQNKSPEHLVLLRPGEEMDWGLLVKRFMQAQPNSKNKFLKQRIFHRKMVKSPVYLNDEGLNLAGVTVDYSKMGMKIFIPQAIDKPFPSPFVTLSYWTEVKGQYLRIQLVSKIKWAKSLGLKSDEVAPRGLRSGQGTFIGLEIIGSKG